MKREVNAITSEPAYSTPDAGNEAMHNVGYSTPDITRVEVNGELYIKKYRYKKI